MQDDELILAENIAKLMKQIRLGTKKSLNLFCNEYSIPTSTLSDVENANTNMKLFSLYKILKTYGFDVVEFFKLLEKELPKNFLKPEE